jgi:hypothetical protein
VANSSLPPRQVSGPLRAVVVVVEVLAVVALGVLAYRWWQRGVVVTVGHRVTLDRIDGRWWGAAAVAVTLAGLLLLSAGRQALLAVRPRFGDRHG